MDIDWAFAGFLVTMATLFGTFLARKRIARALGKMIFDAAPGFIEDYLWEEVEEVVEAGPKGGAAKKMMVKHLRKPAMDTIKGLTPVLVQAALQSVQVRLPQNLPINPATGQIDLLAPIASKLMSGKKVNLQDLVTPFLPMAMELGKGLAVKVGDVVGGMAKKAPTAAGELSPVAQKILAGAMQQ